MLWLVYILLDAPVERVGGGRGGGEFGWELQGKEWILFPVYHRCIIEGSDVHRDKLRVARRLKPRRRHLEPCSSQPLSAL